MGKHKPKLCRMKRLVFPKNHIFLFTEKNKSMYPPIPIPLSTLQPIYDHPLVISHCGSGTCTNGKSGYATAN